MRVKIDNPSQWDEPVVIADEKPLVRRQGDIIQFLVASGRYQASITVTKQQLEELGFK